MEEGGGNRVEVRNENIHAVYTLIQRERKAYDQIKARKRMRKRGDGWGRVCSGEEVHEN